mmetsp:Transcript_8522/g.13023  ORF Transcript_8522/g.13023 Transcript_8522/m.13023 type:complete len:333 (-) Transcript_8522:169-1167(-)
MVALHSSLMASSAAASQRQGTRKNPSLDLSPDSNMDFISSYVLISKVFAFILSSALVSRSLCTSSRIAEIECVNLASWSSAGRASSRLSPPVRSATTHWPALASRGPISMRTGTPLRSHSKYLAPGRSCGRSSTLTRTPALFSWATIRSTCRRTRAVSSPSPLVMGTITACTGATGGGSTRPASSECVMTSAPSSRVLTPQEVAHTSSRPPSAVWKNTSKARAKFWPRKCEVPLCSAQPFCIRASMVKVSSAPANRSEGLFTPLTTGTASTRRQTSSYTSSISRAVPRASAELACAVWPSCQRNSAERRKGRVRSSQRTTLAHWLIFSGRSR